MRRLLLAGLCVLGLVACKQPDHESGKCYRVTDEYSAATKTTVIRYARVPCPEETLAGTATAKLATATPWPTPRPFLRPRETSTPATIRGVE